MHAGLDALLLPTIHSADNWMRKSDNEISGIIVRKSITMLSDDVDTRNTILRDYIKGSVPPWSGCLLNADIELLLEPYESPMIARTDSDRLTPPEVLQHAHIFSLVSAASARPP
jgi:hypothetical protein